MSRTKRGSKAPGYEFWSRRPANQGATGRYAKQRTHRAERAQGKRQAQENSQ